METDGEEYAYSESYYELSAEIAVHSVLDIFEYAENRGGGGCEAQAGGNSR